LIMSYQSCRPVNPQARRAWALGLGVLRYDTVAMPSATLHDAYLEPYRQALTRHGCGFRVSLWASPARQRRRFAVMARMARLAGQRVLDAGCGRGDFAAFLLEHHVEFAQYVGVDALAEVIDYAGRQALPRCRFVQGDVLRSPELLLSGQPQVICLCGTLNTMTDAQVFALLEAAWGATGRSLVFNFLSDRVSAGAVPQRLPVRRFDTLAMLDWALKRTSQVSFRQDYLRHGHDATILMRKGTKRRSTR
jgi:SAM-dependent methyltransferase